MVSGECRVARGLGPFRGSTLRLAEEAVEDRADDHPGEAEGEEADPPPVALAEDGAEPAAEDRAGVDARLVQREGPAARLGPVVVGRQRHRRWKIKRLAKAFESADGDEVPELRAPSGGDGDEAPEDAAAEDQVDALDAVGDESSERGPGGINPHERRADEAELEFVEAKLLLEEREHRRDRLPVGVVEEAHHPQHRHHLPAVAQPVARPGAHRLLGKLHPDSPPTTSPATACRDRW